MPPPCLLCLLTLLDPQRAYTTACFHSVGLCDISPWGSEVLAAQRRGSTGLECDHNPAGRKYLKVASVLGHRHGNSVEELSDCAFTQHEIEYFDA